MPSPFIGFVKNSKKAIFVPIDEHGIFRQREALRVTEPRDVSNLALKIHLKCEGEMARWHGMSHEKIHAIYATRPELTD